MSFKELKTKSRRMLKKHYGLLFAICLFASLFGTAYLGSTLLLKGLMGYGVAQEAFIRDAEEAASAYSDLISGDLDKASEHAKEREEQEKKKNERIGGLEIGRKAGLLATLSNSIMSGQGLVSIVVFICSVVGSRSGGLIVIGVAVLLFLVAIWIFGVNVYSIITSRIFLEASTYEKVPVNRLTFLLYVRKWGNAALIMAYDYLIQFLWSLTIVGGVIKHYAYLLVPYIAAENPALSAKEVLDLSDRMMDGHKMEAFKLDLSFLGWHALSILTLGILDLVYAAPLHEGAYTYYYIERRKAMIENVPETEILLNDRYLYEIADAETLYEKYADIRDMKAEEREETLKDEEKEPFYTRWFGIYFRRNKIEMDRKKREIRSLKIKLHNAALKGETYPGRLFPIPENEFRNPLEILYYSRTYSSLSVVVLFFAFSMVGYVWEVFYRFINFGQIVNRGFLHGPWLPIYGSGALIILLLLYRLRKKPVLEFIAAFTVCGIAEYFTGLFLELANNGEKWWDYSGFFLNLDGRICLEGLLFFALAGSVGVYVLAPLIDNLVQRVKRKILVPICIALVVIFAADCFVSFFIAPNKGDGISSTESVGKRENIKSFIIGDIYGTADFNGD